MAASRHFHLRFFSGGYTADDAAYGSLVTYGEDPFTYGQQASQTTLTGTDYELLPSPGWHPQDPAWVFREADTTRFSALIVDVDDPTEQVDVSVVVQADLILTQWTNDGAKAWKRGFPLVADVDTNTLYRDWVATDLIVQGRFRAALRVLFESGRYMTVETNDSVVFQVNASQQTQADDTDFVFLLTPQGEGILTPQYQALALPEGQDA
ncbi:hypothetical protein DRQ53_13790 [bacterium]|nr:MAG: hypothetical protein DRQ53_13790 [bacterium]